MDPGLIWDVHTAVSCMALTLRLIAPGLIVPPFLFAVVCRSFLLISLRWFSITCCKRTKMRSSITGVTGQAHWERMQPAIEIGVGVTHTRCLRVNSVVHLCHSFSAIHILLFHPDLNAINYGRAQAV